MTENRSEYAIWRELDLSVSDKVNGQTGKAWVLARRAVEKACQALLKTQDHLHTGLNALGSIRILGQFNVAKSERKPLLSHFLLHADTDHHLPASIDLVKEADYLISEITKMTLKRSWSYGEY